MNKKSVLITGISGFIGSYMAKYLLDTGNKVYGLVRRRADGSKPRNLVDKGIYSEVHLIEGDITDISSIGFALERAQPDVIFHLAAQSFIPRSFINPLETLDINSLGTANLLESVRLNELDPVIVFAGSSEEYGLVFASDNQYKRAIEKYGSIFPEPVKMPELPITEANPLRPMSPYAVSKVQSEYIMRNYWNSYGLRTIVSRSFNTEGASRGPMFVTSVVTSQVMKLRYGESAKIVIGNINAFRDWSYVLDIIKGYCLLAEKGKPGEVYNQGSMRTNSVLSYLLLALENAGWKIGKIESMDNSKVVENPTERSREKLFGIEFELTKVDKLMLAEELEFTIEDRGIKVHTNKGKIPVGFDPARFRPAEVPILLADTKKIQELGFRIEYKLEHIIRDQLDYFSKKDLRK